MKTEAQRRGKNSKLRGANFERKCKKDLEAAGFAVGKVMASIGVADLWASHPDWPTCWVQCKSGVAVLSKQEWDELYQAATHFKCLPIYVMRDYKFKGRGKPTRWYVLEGEKIPRKQLKDQPIKEWVWK